ncbi:MAG: ABC transporter ATP-binding protein [Synechococcales cyanobacterium RM1_1_8]|nr:ABC transporter ATP-binding protein [Synechococcales cyanobacterium RM1_1_8]
MVQIFRKINALLDGRDRLEFSLIIVLTLVGAIAETLGVGVIPSFVGLLGSAKALQEVGIVGWAYDLAGFNDYRVFVQWACVALMGLYIGKNSYLAWLSYLQIRFIYRKQCKVSQRLLSRYLQQPYTFHLEHNTADLQRNINVEIPNLFNEVMRDVMILLTESLIALCITLLLLLAEPLSTLIAVSLLGIAMLVFYQGFRRRIELWGRRQHRHVGRMIRWVSQGLGSLKETKVLGREPYFLERYSFHVERYTDATRQLQFVNKLPRLFIETLAVVCLLLVLMVDLSQGRRPRSLLLLLSLFAVAAFRLMMSLNRIVAAVTTIRFYSEALDAVYQDLTQVHGEDNFSALRESPPAYLPPVCFQQRIVLDRVSYVYPNSKNLALASISLQIERGEAIGLAGPSGAGKTTLVDVLLGLLQPTAGEVLVDGVPVQRDLAAWQRQLGYIPQQIYLSDDTIRRNVAFGLADANIDDSRIWQVLRLAQLEDFVRGLPLRLNSQVGEQGVRLSGGQRQRIAIARSLYHNPEVVVMDEATAALDNGTEREIVSAMENLIGKKTLIVIAHRLSTIRNCDRIYWIRDGAIADVGTYDDLLARNREFQAMVGP